MNDVESRHFLSATCFRQHAYTHLPFNISCCKQEAVPPLRDLSHRPMPGSQEATLNQELTLVTEMKAESNPQYKSVLKISPISTMK